MRSRLSIEIVRATSADDVRLIASLYPRKTPNERHEMIRRHLLPELLDQEQGSRTILLARSNGCIIGTVQVVWDTRTEPALHAPGSAIIHHLRTHPRLQGQGVGTQMIGAAEQCASSRGLVRLALAVEPENHRAHRLYTSLGFNEYARFRGQAGEPLLAMEKRLSDSPVG